VLCLNWAPRHEGALAEWRYSSTHSLTSALDGGEWSASRPGRFTPRERAPGTHWIGSWMGPRAALDAVLICCTLQIFHMRCPQIWLSRHFRMWTNQWVKVAVNLDFRNICSCVVLCFTRSTLHCVPLSLSSFSQNYSRFRHKILKKMNSDNIPQCLGAVNCHS
jgi:hypothetical protein